mmetsp:Transcript_2034/g.3903  ORF Transcript_2034/g.3903 Transcript_2034/m.3903 type:complete len:336 (+) Transcript_2034:700-1707(+)
MIVASIISRYAFLQSIASSAIRSSFLYTNVMNAPQSSPSLTPDKLDAQMKISSSLVREDVSQYLNDDPTVAGGLLRLAFHDATTRECDESGTSCTGGPNGSIKYEIDWTENRGIARPLRVVQSIYDNAGVNNMGLSFADCIALAGAESVEFAGGPRIPIKLGRIDSSEADAKKRRNVLQDSTDRSLVDTTLPSAGLDSDGLRLYFGALGLSEKEFVALSGAHDLGRHVTLLDMPKSCLKDLTRECLENAPVLMPFVAEEPDRFSNAYFKKLLRWYDRNIELGEVAFIPTDVDLVVDEGLRTHVQHFAKDEASFFSTFTLSYQKLVDIGAVSRERY